MIVIIWMYTCIMNVYVYYTNVFVYHVYFVAQTKLKLQEYIEMYILH